VELLAGDPAAAEIHLRAAYETAERIGDLGHLASVAPDLGNVVYEQARYDEALHLAETGERLTIVGDLDAGVRWRQLKAMALARLGGFDEATALATEAVDMVSGTENLDLHAHALLGLVEVHRLAGRPAEAASAAREAIALYRRKGHVVGERRLTEQLAELDG
jgi:tetratricopeptide (TPR) repeat protein